MTYDPNPKPFPTARFFIAGTLAFVLLYGFNPVIESLGLDDYKYPAEARAFTKQIQEFTSEDVQEISKPSNKPLLLHIYASWCPYCRQQSPVIDDILHGHGSNIDVLMLSLDQSPNQLAQFLMQKAQPLPYTPYIISKRNAYKIRALIQKSGGSFDGGIPYTAIFNAEGKLVADFHGMRDKNALEQGLQQAD